jgi:hypothetical protein
MIRASLGSRRAIPTAANGPTATRQFRIRGATTNASFQTQRPTTSGVLGRNTRAVHRAAAAVVAAPVDRLLDSLPPKQEPTTQFVRSRNGCHTGNRSKRSTGRSKATSARLRRAAEAEARLQELVRYGIGPGAFARGSCPADTLSRAKEREFNNRNGAEGGCHTCGIRDPGNPSGNWYRDHQSPNALSEIFDRAQRIFPQCASCSHRQGAWITNWLKSRKEEK